MGQLRRIVARRLRLIAYRLDPNPRTVVVRLSADTSAFERAMSAIRTASPTEGD